MSWGQALASLGSGLVRGMATEDDRQRVEAERARLRAVEQMTRERQTRLDTQAQEQQTFQNRQKQAETTRLMAGAGFTPYDEGTVNGAEAQQAGAFDAMAPAPMAGAAGAATRLLGQVKAKRLADSQGGYVKTAMSDQERIRQDEREARVEGQRASLAQAAQLARERMAAEADRARESNQTRRDLAGIAAAARQGQQTQLKRIPNAAFESMKDNDMALSQVDQALSAITNAPQALGMTNMGPGEWLKNKVGGATADEQLARAAVADIGSQIIHDRSGAAVTISEFPRLAPFVPLKTDTEQEARVKLTRLKTLMRQEADLYRANFGEDQGYQPFVSNRPVPDVRNDAPRGATIPARRPGETIAQWRARTGGQ